MLVINTCIYVLHGFLTAILYHKFLENIYHDSLHSPSTHRLCFTLKSLVTGLQVLLPCPHSWWRLWRLLSSAAKWGKASCPSLNITSSRKSSLPASRLLVKVLLALFWTLCVFCLHKQGFVYLLGSKPPPGTRWHPSLSAPQHLETGLACRRWIINID